MPNWCSNALTLTGPKKLLEELAESQFSFNSILPCPEDLKGVEKSFPVTESLKLKEPELIAKYGAATEYDWRVNHWGTKWDIDPLDLTIEQRLEFKGKKMVYIPDAYYIEMSFDTAYSPPVKVIEHFWNKFKDQGLNLSMEYIESSSQILGKLTTKNGEFHQKDYSYEDSDELEEYISQLQGHSLGESHLESLKFDEE